MSQALFLVIASRIAFSNRKTVWAALLLAVGFSCYSFLFIMDVNSVFFPMILAMNQMTPLAAYFLIESISPNSTALSKPTNILIGLIGISLISLYSFADLHSSMNFRLVINIWNALLIASAGVSLWQGYRDDLNKTRTLLRVVITGGMALYVLIIGLISTTRPLDGSLHMILRAIEGGLLTTMGLVVNAILVQPPVFSLIFSIERISKPTSDTQKPPLSQQLDELEALNLKITHLMETERLFLSQGLNLQDLAEKAETPVYRVRYFLNQHLGHENFSIFLNTYRLRYAADLLANPSRSDDKIFAIALEAGFSSLAPFNKAFKNLFGITPSEYRDNMLSPKSEAISTTQSSISREEQ